MKIQVWYTIMVMHQGSREKLLTATDTLIIEQHATIAFSVGKCTPELIIKTKYHRHRLRQECHTFVYLSDKHRERLLIRY